MIYDTLDNAQKYISLNKYYEKAFGFISSLKPDSEEGTFEIDGKKCYAIIYSSELKNSSDAKLEVHDNYIDIQSVICGSEGFGIASRSNCTQPIGEIDTEKDILFFEDKSKNYLELTPGEFAIFEPCDAHAPLIGNGSVKKVVIKVISQ